MKAGLVNRLVLLGVLSLAVLIPSPSEAMKFTEAEKQTLVKGETVKRVFEDNGKNRLYGGSGWVLVDAPPDKVWSSILEWSIYPKIFLYNVETKEIRRRKNRSVLRMKIGHPILNLIYHVEMSLDKHKRTIKFKLIENMATDLEQINGFWRMFPQPGGKTLLVYVLNVRIPKGLELLLTESFKRDALLDLLNVPGVMKDWVERGVTLDNPAGTQK